MRMRRSSFTSIAPASQAYVAGTARSPTGGHRRPPSALGQLMGSCVQRKAVDQFWGPAPALLWARHRVVFPGERVRPGLVTEESVAVVDVAPQRHSVA